jgi:hypothetical protein
MGGAVRILAIVASGLALAGSTPARGERTAWFPGAAQPTALAVGDENGDGRVDVLTGNESRSSSVLLDRGDGRLSRGVPFRASPGEHESMEAGDLNRDGILDEVVFNQADTVSVLLADGRGGLRPPTDYPVGPEPWSGVVADLTGDGAADVVVADWENARLVVLVNDGSGALRPAAEYPAPLNGAVPAQLAAGDLNGDGHVDIAAATGGVTVLLGNGDGTLRAPESSLVGTNAPNIALADFNRDGKLDVVVGTWLESSLDVGLGNGDGTFGASRSFDSGLISPDRIVVADFNGDGKLDVATATYPGPNDPDARVGVLLGRGDGTFEPRRLYAADRAHEDPLDVAAADVNGDGRAEILTASGTSVSVLNANADGTFSAPVAYPAGPPFCDLPMVVDLPLAAAERAIHAAGCRVGRILREYSRTHVRGHVIGQSPDPSVLDYEPPRGATVGLVVSRGPGPAR